MNVERILERLEQRRQILREMIQDEDAKENKREELLAKLSGRACELNRTMRMIRLMNDGTIK